jgi:hypothetical protein
LARFAIAMRAFPASATRTGFPTSPHAHPAPPTHPWIGAVRTAQLATNFGEASGAFLEASLAFDDAEFNHGFRSNRRGVRPRPALTAVRYLGQREHPASEPDQEKERDVWPLIRNSCDVSHR